MKQDLSRSTIAAYADAQSRYLTQIAAHCDYAITLQTNLYTCGISDSTMQQRVYAVQAALGYLRPRLNRLLTGNGYRRKDQYLPVFIPAIEGRLNTYDRNRTLHVHAALGNVGHTVTDDSCSLLQLGITEIWTQTDIGTSDVRIVPIRQGTHQRWMDYTGKEAQDRQNIDVIDYSNAQIPQFILNAIDNKA